MWVDWYHQHAELMIVSAQNCVLVPTTASIQHILCNAQQLNVRRSTNKPVLCCCIWNFFGRVIIKWRWWMWMVAAYRRTHSPSCLAWCEGWQPSGIESIFIKWTRWTVAMALSRDDSTVNVAISIIIIIIIIFLPQYSIPRKWKIHYAIKKYIFIIITTLWEAIM